MSRTGVLDFYNVILFLAAIIYYLLWLKPIIMSCTELMIFIAPISRYRKWWNLWDPIHVCRGVVLAQRSAVECTVVSQEEIEVCVL